MKYESVLMNNEYISNISELYTGVHGRNIAIYDVSDVKHGKSAIHRLLFLIC